MAAKETLNLHVLIDLMIQTVNADKINEEDVIVTNARHYEFLKNAHEAIYVFCRASIPVLPAISLPRTSANACTTWAILQVKCQRMRCWGIFSRISASESN
jgi:hypothetical protein